MEQAVNPFLPSYEYIPDGEPHVFGDRVYLYGSHDRFNGNDFCLNDYVCWSAPVDCLGEWRNEGIIYHATQDPLNKEGKQHLFAPDVIRGRDGRYYLFYCLHMSPTVSVAVCDKPCGKYEFYGHVHYANNVAYGTRMQDVFNFDPGVLQDENGRVYLYTGISHPRTAPMRQHLETLFRIDGAYCVELEDDLLTIKGEPCLVMPGEAVAQGTSFENHAFFEASSPRKIGEKYYLIYSSEQSHDLCYGISDSPLGPFVYGGVLVDLGDIGIVSEKEARDYLGNTHGGMGCINRQWYIFYHRHTNRSRNCRQMCAEKIQILQDGRIPQAERTSCGLQKELLAGHGRYEARIACNLNSVDGVYMYQKDMVDGKQEHPYFTQDGEDRDADPDQHIANIKDGTWAGFKYFNMETEGRLRVCVRGNAEGSLCVSTTKGGEACGNVSVHSSTGWKVWEGEYRMPAGKQALYFTFKGTGSLDWLWFEI